MLGLDWILLLVEALVFPTEFPSSFPHFITSRSPQIEAFELGFWNE